MDGAQQPIPMGSAWIPWQLWGQSLQPGPPTPVCPQPLALTELIWCGLGAAGQVSSLLALLTI